jgi:hypothetical protein
VGRAVRKGGALIYETGRLSPKHEIGVSWFQGEVKRALDL